MDSVSLQNFTSIFEILFAYNIGIAFSEKFRNFLGIDNSVDRFITNHKEYQEISRIIVSQSEYFNDTKFIKLSRNFLSLREKAKCYFENHRLELFLKPFYIYYGLACLFLLFYAGTLKTIVHEAHLMFLNTISTLILFFCFIGSFLVRKIDWKAGPIRFFLWEPRVNPYNIMYNEGSYT